MASEIYLAENGEQIGPLTDEQVRARIESGETTESTFAWIEGAPDWKPIVELLPELFAMTIAVSASALAQGMAPETSAQPAPAPAQEAPPAAEPVQAPEHPPATTIEVPTIEDLRLPRVLLDNDAVVVEATALHYTRGAVTSEPLVGRSGAPEGTRATCRGTGEVALAPTFAECVVLDLAGESWILDEGAFLACDHTISVETVAAGEGLLQTKVSGHGKLLLRAPGPVERVQLENETLVVNGAFAVARSATIGLTVHRAGRGLTRTLHGSGTVLFAPVPHRGVALAAPASGKS